jgi:hypothetical protein
MVSTGRCTGTMLMPYREKPRRYLLWHMWRRGSMKIKIRRGQYLGDKIIGFIYSECYSETVYGIVFWNYGIFVATSAPLPEEG